jgi:CRP/FNR family cyclic AMP-dependent transcriptional regulator
VTVAQSTKAAAGSSRRPAGGEDRPGPAVGRGVNIRAGCDLPHRGIAQEVPRWAGSNHGGVREMLSNSTTELTMRNPAAGQRDRVARRVSGPIELLRGHSVLGQLPAEAIEQLSAYVARRRVERGATIFVKGDPGQGLMAVVRGSVRISLPAAGGREVVLNRIRAGEVFGEMALLDGQSRSADATAIEDCELLVIDRRNLLHLVHQKPEVAVKLLEVLCARLRRANEQVEDAMFMSLPVRLAKLLLSLARATGTDEPKERIAITQRELSQMIGVSREATNKQLRTWEKRGWIRLEHRTLTVLDRAALARVEEEDER